MNHCFIEISFPLSPKKGSQMLYQKRPNPIDAKKIKREEDHRDQSNNGCVPYLVGRRPRYTPHFRANVAQKLRGPREESRRMRTSCGFAFTPNCWRGFGQSAANLVFFFAHRYSGFSQFPSMAGVPGFEPGLSVLETDVLTVDTIPLRLSDAGTPYFVSL